MRKNAILIILGCLLVTSCVRKTETADYAATFEIQARETIITEYTQTALSITPTPLSTPTPFPPTQTPTASPTPEIGTFKNPAGINQTIIRHEGITMIWKMSMTLLEVQKGENAKIVAMNNIPFFSYSNQVEGQEYIAIRVRLDLLEKKDGEFDIESLSSYGDITLRYEEEGEDIWPFDLDLWVEGYVPLSAEGWVFFAIKEGSQPLIYFHPRLMTTERLGMRTGGAFFSLE